MSSLTIFRRARRCALAATLAAAVAAPAAGASTLEYDAGGALVFTGGPGTTYLDLERGDDGRIVLLPNTEDEPASLPPGCERPDDSGSVVCEAGQAGGVRVLMGEGDDGVIVRMNLAVPVLVDGGAGDDQLTGKSEDGAETLHGGPGDDRVSGGGGGDTVEGGDGDDQVAGGAGADSVLGGDGTDKLSGDDGKAMDGDLIDGGAGLDTVESDWHPLDHEGHGPVTVTLAGGDDDGHADERDNVRNVEILSVAAGGRYVGTDGADTLSVGGKPAEVDARGGDDRIVTSYSADRVDAGAGDDHVRGYGGDDHIVGGPGRDTLLGDAAGTTTCTFLDCQTTAGNDVIDARDGERDSLDCGPGTDQALVDAADVVANCEDVRVLAPEAQAGDPGLPLAGQAGGGSQGGPRITVASRSRRAALAKGLRVRLDGARPGRQVVTARLGRAVVGRCRARVAADGSGACLLRFTRAGARKVRAARRPVLRFSAAGGSASVRLGGATAARAAAKRRRPKTVTYKVTWKGHADLRFASGPGEGDAWRSVSGEADIYVLGRINRLVMRGNRVISASGPHSRLDVTASQQTLDYDVYTGTSSDECKLRADLPWSLGSASLEEDEIPALNGDARLVARPFGVDELVLACGTGGTMPWDLATLSPDGREAEMGRGTFDAPFTLPREAIGMGKVIQRVKSSDRPDWTPDCSVLLQGAQTQQTCRLDWDLEVTFRRIGR
jgi:Ca2+-binding RTX toxin-like protein